MPEKRRFGVVHLPIIERTKMHIVTEVMLGVMGFALLITTVIILINS